MAVVWGINVKPEDAICFCECRAADRHKITLKGEKEMENVVITEEKIREILAEKLPIWIEKNLNSDYSNPIKDAIEEELKAKNGIIREAVREIMAKVFNDEEFKKAIGDKVIQKVIERGLK